jgi:long-chain acyl-CoA synthetase
MLHVMPMGYMAGFLNTVLCPLVAGGTVVVSTQFSAQSAADFWKDAIAGSVSALWLSPTMAALVTRMTRDQFSVDWVKENAKHIFVGTAPLPATVKDAFESKFSVPCLESYGMTEVLLVAVNLPNQSAKPASAGKILPEVDIRAEENGDLFIRSPFSLTRYIGSAEQEAIEFIVQSWFPTGDIGHVDDDEYLYITGRKKDLIIHGGMNVSPRAVEEAIYRFPGVQDVSVVGRPHAFWGEEVAAFIVLHKGQSFDQKAFSSHCEKILSPDAIPSVIKIVEELPRSSTGKIQKHLLKDML